MGWHPIRGAFKAVFSWLCAPLGALALHLHSNGHCETHSARANSPLPQPPARSLPPPPPALPLCQSSVATTAPEFWEAVEMPPESQPQEPASYFKRPAHQSYSYRAGIQPNALYVQPRDITFPEILKQGARGSMFLERKTTSGRSYISFTPKGKIYIHRIIFSAPQNLH